MKKAASVRWQRSKRLNDVGPFYLERGMIFGKGLCGVALYIVS